MTHKIEKLSVEFNWARNRLFDKPCTQALLMLCQADGQVTVKNVQQKPKNKWRPQPMDTIELEKTGSRKLRLSAKTIMTIAEKLYTQGYISYPRTETNQFSKEINLRALVELQTPHPDWGDFAGRVVSKYLYFLFLLKKKNSISSNGDQTREMETSLIKRIHRFIQQNLSALCRATRSESTSS